MSDIPRNDEKIPDGEQPKPIAERWASDEDSPVMVTSAPTADLGPIVQLEDPQPEK